MSLPAGTQQDVESALLYAAYERKPLNVLMTAVSTVLIGAVIWPLFPPRVMGPWLLAILASAAAGYLECGAFQRAAPASEDIPRWRVIFMLQSGASGAAWSLGPALLIPQVQGNALALLLVILLLVCVIAMVSVAEQRGGMQAFLAAALLPPIVVLGVGGGQVERSVALVLACGLVAMVIVGRNAHQATRSLLDAQFRMGAILHASQDAIVGIDAQGHITDWNRRAEAIFGQTQQAVLGLPFGNTLIPARHRAVYSETLARFLAAGDHPRMHQRIRTTALRATGEEFPVEMAFAPLQQGGHFHFIGFVTDATERKAAEERLAMFRRIFDVSSQLISVLDGGGHAIYQNRAHALALGYADQDLLGQLFTLTVAPESVETCATVVRQAMGSGDNWTGQLVMQRQDGSRFIASINIGCIKDSKGKVQYIFNIFSDFSQELARRNELALAKEAAEGANRAKSDFLSSMSHELRTPMNAIIGFAQMLEYDSGLNADQQDNVHEILKASRHLLDLINDVLDLARIESGHIHLSLETVGLADLLADCCLLMQPLADARQISLQVVVPAQASVRADRVRFKQVLLNLLSNAVKYNREGGDIQVETAPAAQGGLRISVADSGAGIAEGRLGELFQPFNRLGEEHGEIEGTGIGLSITRQLVELMGGEVGVDSTLGVGTTFWVELPTDGGGEGQDRAAPAAHGDGAEGDDGDEGEPSGWATSSLFGMVETTSARDVLYVDDNPASLKRVVQALAQRPQVRLVTAHTLALGLELAMAQPPDLVLLDIDLSGTSGPQMLAAFKADERLKAIPVIAVTASPGVQQHAGFQACLPKPLAPDLFLQTLDRYLPDAGREATP